MSITIEDILSTVETNSEEDSLFVMPPVLTFTWDQVGDGSLSVTSNTDWTCSFDTGINFTADIYGGSGNDLLTVSCVGDNELPADLTDTLRFYIGAVEYDTVVITQYQM